ncbi:MBL fold metallo-hydrolase [Nocardia miyunensis]|uniref:MBL fold metallo-hydrolase n=1 Tax=Nocardia miyunensis TaxID=282684 RepID=UPI00082A5FD1|nr:MBL fold metallo-hydrolase [Nocardia miyunensis]
MRTPFGRPGLEPYTVYQRQAAARPGGLTAHFLGTSSLLLSDGATTLLCDGFVTRPGLMRVGLGRIAPDAGLVRAAIERLGVRSLDAVFCAHSHYDHALDAPVWCLQTGAVLVGSESTANIGRGLGLAETSLRVVGDGDTLDYGRFTLTFLDSVHSPGDRYPGVVTRPLVPPARTGAWKTGAAYSVLIEHPVGRILLHASANHRPGMLDGRRAEVVYLGIGGLGKQSREFVRRYWDEVVGAVGARRVVLVHWDDFFVGLDRPLRPLPYFADRFDVTMAMLLPLAQRDGVEVVLPVAWDATDPHGELD